jgi:hypothetical protein
MSTTVEPLSGHALTEGEQNTLDALALTLLGMLPGRVGLLRAVFEGREVAAVVVSTDDEEIIPVALLMDDELLHQVRPCTAMAE